MQDVRRPIAALAAPTLGVALAAGLLLLVALSITIQPPQTGEGDALQQALAWMRAVLFSAGAAAFLLGLVAFLRSGPAPAEPVWPERATAERSGRAAKPRGAYTLVALGDTPDDARAISDVTSAHEAIETLRRWKTGYPDERVVVFAPDGAPVAFSTPAPIRRP